MQTIFRIRLATILAAALTVISVSPAAAQRRGFGGGGQGVYKAQLQPHWIAGGPKFWYQNELPGGKREFILVDPDQGKREPAFDHEKLAAALKEAGVADASATRLSLDALEFKLADRTIEF